MNTLLYALRDEQKMRTFLFWYWLISPFVFFFYRYSVSASTGIELKEMLNEPAIALAFLASCMSLIMAGLLRGAEAENELTEKRFAMFAVVQQLIVGNILGFLLSFFYARSLWDAGGEPFAPRLRWVLMGGMVLIGLLTLLTVIANINMALR
ncbi:MAG: cell shape determination protein CcmA [Rothia sp. (in: high G+C Gram-positive bacteria)]|nr:cell shape determination protein CcmA [Rothia sp. (in: high G+C Gram-positive bacteria)]